MLARSVAAAVGVAGALLAGGSTAAAVPLPPSDAPLPGSSFQGGDGNQADSAPLVDWQGLQATGRVRHSSDPNAQDSAFAGGAKENNPGDWSFTTEAGGVSPAKSNLLDAWASVDQPGGDTFLYLAFARATGKGTTNVAVELNRDGRLWDNGQAMVPCRRTGDIVIAYEASGDAADVTLQQWTTTTADPASGCAREGHLTDSDAFVANQDVQGQMNAGAIANHLPGSEPVPGTFANAEFGEASLDLAKVLGDAFRETCLAFSSIWAHSRSSTSGSASMQDYIAPRPLTVRACSASGTKFFDSNSNGVRDPGEPGIPRFLIWADYNGDGVQDGDEPFSVTDRQGDYVIFDIKPPNGSYMLRETLLPRATRPRGALDWLCSLPHAPPPAGMTGSAPGRFGCAWGPIDVHATPNATGRDFGNWFPARLTVEKQLEPVDDPGRFDLRVNGQVVLPAGGDNASVTLNLPPGAYDISEAATPGTDSAAYTSSVDCHLNVSGRGAPRSGTSFPGLELKAGQRASCVFRNIRKGTPSNPTPAIGIRKSGPAQAVAGDTLHYKLEVTNPGEVAFAAESVHVTDPGCDHPPALVSKEDTSGPDSTPGTLDPGDTWIYSCSHATPSGAAGCQPSIVDNTGTVTGDTATGSVNDDDSIETDLLCPDQPDTTPEPIGSEPGLGPVAPPGATPPTAGDAGIGRLEVLGARSGCLASRVAHLNLSGTRVARVRVFVNGHLRRTLRFGTLERRVTPRVPLPPGRDRVVARMTFQPGSGTPPVTLVANVRVCGERRVPVRFTG